MQNFRRTLLRLTAACLAVLAAASVFASFLGADRATTFFFSLPLVVFWAFLLLLLIAGLVVMPRLRRSPDLLAMHLGFALVLIGGMWGSPMGHRVLNSSKTPRGYMVIYEGQSSDRILAADLRTERAKLPFSIRLEDFRIEYYGAESRRWQLYYVAPSADSKRGVREAVLFWKSGGEVALPGLRDARVEVLDYLPRARPVFERGPVLEVTQANGETKQLPVRYGAEMRLDEPPVTVKVVRIFGHLAVIGMKGERRIVDRPGSDANPAVQVELRRPDGTREYSYVSARFHMHDDGDGDDGIRFRYLQPDPTGAVADPASDRPAMRVRVHLGERVLDHWLIPRRGESLATVPLDRAAGTALCLARPVLPPGPVKDYLSELAVTEHGRAVTRRTIEVNRPLHHDGYHFYQYGFDEAHGAYTVLLVSSDTGLASVVVGLALMTPGVFWWCWGRPAFRFLRGRGQTTEEL